MIDASIKEYFCRNNAWYGKADVFYPVQVNRITMETDDVFPSSGENIVSVFISEDIIPDEVRNAFEKNGIFIDIVQRTHLARRRRGFLPPLLGQGKFLLMVII